MIKTSVCSDIACYAAMATGFFAVVLAFVGVGGGDGTLAAIMLGMAATAYLVPMFIIQAKKAALSVIQLENSAAPKP
jgi:hypothetical protein